MGSYVADNNSLTVEMVLDIHLEVDSWDFHHSLAAVHLAVVSTGSPVVVLEMD